MDDAKYPAFDTKPYRIVKSRSEASVPVNAAPTYYIVASDLQGFPLQQAIPLVQMSASAQPAPRPPENQLPPLPVPRPGTPMRWYIASLLRCLGVPARLSGFNYLVETLLLLVNRPFETRRTRWSRSSATPRPSGWIRRFARRSTRRGRSRTFLCTAR